MLAKQEPELDYSRNKAGRKKEKTQMDHVTMEELLAAREMAIEDGLDESIPTAQECETLLAIVNGDEVKSITIN